MAYNLLTETIKVLESYKKTPADVLWVERHKRLTISDPITIQRGTWEDFALLAANGGAYTKDLTNPTLVIVGDGWWMSFVSRIGIPFWEYNTPPTYDPNSPPLSSWRDDK